MRHVFFSVIPSGLVTAALGLLLVSGGIAPYTQPLYAQPPAADTANASFMKRLNQELVPAAGAVAGADSAVGSTAGAPATPASAGVMSLLLRITGYLAIVLLIIAAITWFIRGRRQASRGRPGGGAMDLLEVLPLGQGRNLLLVRVSDRVFLLGQTPDQIAKIDGFEGEKAVELITASKGGGILQFKDAFNSFMSKMVRKPS